jgi:hypothetical protein
MEKMYELCVVIDVDRICVVFESDTSSMGSHITWGVPHNVTHDDLMAAVAQGEPAACDSAQGGQELRYQRGGAPVKYALQM